MPFIFKKDGFFVTLRRKRITTVAGAWVFFFTIALIPLTVLLLLAFNVLGIDAGEKFLPYLPLELKQTFEELLLLATDGLKGLTIFFVISVFVSGSALLNQMSKDGDFIYGVKRSKRGVFRRIKAMLALLILFVVFLLSAVLLAFSDAFLLRIKKSALSSIFAKISIPLILVSVCYLIIILLNKFISPVKLDAKSLLLGSLASLVIIIVGTLGFSFYMKFFRAGNALSLGIVSALAFLSWLYILTLGLIIGATIIVTLRKKQ